MGDNGPPSCERTVSLWDLLNSPSETKENTNPLYDPKLDDPSRRDAQSNMGVLFPDPKDVRFWNELYGRTDEEMNGKLSTAEVQGVDILGPVEGTEDDPATLPANVSASDAFSGLAATLPVSLPSSRPLSPSPTVASPALAPVFPGRLPHRQGRRFVARGTPPLAEAPRARRQARGFRAMVGSGVRDQSCEDTELMDFSIE